MSSGSETGVEDAGEFRSRPRRGIPVGLLGIIAALLGVLLVVATAYAWGMYQHTRDYNQQQHSNAQALTSAEQFVLRMDNFDGTRFDQYISSVNQML
ncbi:MAG: hypothetical protein M3Z50_12190, partial [Actinomycetota bacterium]|nr:hypothetical protein [Actinomycetota bacterium]